MRDRLPLLPATACVWGQDLAAKTHLNPSVGQVWGSRKAEQHLPPAARSVQ